MSDKYYDWVTLERHILNDEKFIEIKIITDLIKELKQHKRTLMPDETAYYRARLINKEDKEKLNSLLNNNDFYGFPASECGAPPTNKVLKGGRCNKANESVLYLAEDAYTALAEVRPGKRQRVNIAEFRLRKCVNVIDIIYEDKIPYSLYSWASFYFYIVHNDNEEYEEYYKISRYITDLIKGLGFDGIRYSSSLSSGGINMVLFDPTVAECINSKIYQTMALLYYAEEQLPRRNNERLLPKSITSKFPDNEINQFLKKFK
jgi:RES domain-containing protein